MHAVLEALCCSCNSVPWAQACLRALPLTRQGQKVNCVPGSRALTDKRSLIETLTGAYGEDAFGILPRTFLLPEQYWEWRLWLQHQVTFWRVCHLSCTSLSICLLEDQFGL
jgi:hypothetical protein